MDIAFVLLGGLGLFLYGMDGMSRNLQRLAGNRMKGFLRAITKNHFVGVLSGTVATAIVQSSSVTTVMIVGFVNAGLMALPQAISVTLGAHIGTTITAQIIAFKIQNLALPLIALGALVRLFGKSEKLKSIGEAVFSFGALFFGLSLMGKAFDPLHDNQVFHSIFENFSRHPLLGIFAGMAVTILAQSSSVTTGITIALALSSLITFEQAVPLILGENIGTTISANIAAIGGSFTAKQAARAHFIVHAIGAFLILLLLAPFMKLTLFVSPAGDTARQIANSHTLFNIITTIMFFPFINLVAKASGFLVFSKKKEEDLYYLEKTSLEDPGTALDQVKTALIEMNDMVLKYLKLVSSAVSTLKEKDMAFMAYLGQKIEHYQSRVTEYLEKIVVKRLSSADSKRVPQFVRIIHEIERVRDYEEKIRAVVVRLQSEGRQFHSVEKKEINALFKEVSALVKKAGLMLRSEGAAQKNLAEEIIGAYDAVNNRKEELRTKSKQRFTSHRTEIATANYYYDIVSSLEEIAKKCRNIAATISNT